MREGIYRFGGHGIRICSEFDMIHRMCREYQWEGKPETVITTTMEDIREERNRSERERQKEGLPEIPFEDSYLETLAIYRKMAEWMIFQNVLLFHGSAIEVDGQAYLFIAKSGMGKSTHARLWRELLGERAEMLNDDKPFLSFSDETIRVYGTPWDGKHHLSRNSNAPLKAIALIIQDPNNRIRKIEAKDVWPFLLQQTYHPQTQEGMGAVLELLDRIAEKVPVYELRCNMKTEAAKLSYSVMSGNASL